MRFIDVYRGSGHNQEVKRHAVDGLADRQLIGGEWYWQAQTMCGRVIRSQHSGECIVPMIDCGSCKRSLRKDGWQI